MKKVLALVLSLGMMGLFTVTLTGCKKDDAQKGKTQAEKNAIEAAKKEVTVTAADVTVKQGGDVEATIKLKRGDSATGKKVKLEAKDDGGVSLAGGETDKDEIKLKVSAKADAKAGEVTLNITGKSDEGITVNPGTLKVTVEKKTAAVEPAKDMKLGIAAADDKEIKIDQGGKADGKVTVTLGKDLDEAGLESAVKGKDDKEAAKIKVTVDKTTKKGDAKVHIEVNDAAPGDYTVTVTAWATDATPPRASVTLKVKVEMKKKGA